MIINNLKLFIALALIIFNLQALAQKNTLTQISTVDALLNGLYEGDVTLEQLKKYGDFGFGTFNGLEGEMFVIQGNFYQIMADGSVKKPPLDTKTPYAVVTFFEAEKTVTLSSPLTYSEFEQTLDKLIPTPNIFYALHIEGHFQHLKARSVPKQQSPYPPIKEIVKTQPIFNFDNVEGIMVGFRCPPYVKGISVPGYHLHFLTQDKTAGGHVLDFTVNQAMVKIDYLSNFSMQLPENATFYHLDLSKDKQK